MTAMADTMTAMPRDRMRRWCQSRRARANADRQLWRCYETSISDWWVGVNVRDMPSSDEVDRVVAAVRELEPVGNGYLSAGYVGKKAGLSPPAAAAALEAAYERGYLERIWWGAATADEPPSEFMYRLPGDQRPGAHDRL
jgi:hypothetical protein